MTGWRLSLPLFIEHMLLVTLVNVGRAATSQGLVWLERGLGLCPVQSERSSPKKRRSVPGQGGARACHWELPLAEGWRAEAGRQPGRELALEGLTDVPTCPPPAAGVLGEYYHGTSEGKESIVTGLIFLTYFKIISNFS